MSNIENDSQGSKARMPVIDLEAEDISPPPDTGETEAAKEEPGPTPPPPSHGPPLLTRNRVLGLAVAVIAAVLGAWLYRQFGVDFWPPSSVSTLERRVGTLEASNRTLNEQLVALSGTLDALKADTAKRAGEATDKISGLDARLADLEKATAELRQSLAAVSTNSGGTTADPAVLADLTRRIEALEQAVAALRSGSTPPATSGGGQDFSGLSQALSDLKAKFAAGVPYEEELDRIAVYVPQNPDLADLRLEAASGIPNAQALGSALEALAPNLASAGGGNEAGAQDGGGFWAWIGSVVKVRDLGTLDWADLARSAAADAKAGDLRGAIARLEQPGGELPPQVAEWRDHARQRLKLEASLAQLNAAVSAIIAGKS